MNIGKSLTLIPVLMFLVGCGVSDTMEAVRETPKKMDNMLERMDHTVDGINEQKKLIPLQQLMDEKNYTLLSPIPAQLMPYGKKLAEVINADELVELTYLWLKEINEVYPAHRLDAQGEEIPFSAEEINRINTTKMGRLVSLQIIAGFLPEATLNEMLTKHIRNLSRYESTALNVLMLRVQFLRDVLLDASLLSEPLDQVGKVKKAIEYNKSIDFIARLRFADQISIKTKGFLKPMENFEEKFNPQTALQKWKRIKLAAERDLQVQQRSFGLDAAEDQRRLEQEKTELTQSLSEIDSFIRSWEQGQVE